MTEKMRGFTKDGWVRVQRTVLRRVVGDRLQALLRGDFYVRNLGEEDYDSILAEVAALDVPAPPNGLNGSRANGVNGAPPHKFTSELECFTQIVAASIMIDASMRGECAGESDTRFIKKKKKLLAKTLQGPKRGDFRREVMRFDMIRRGEDFEEEEIVESEESRSGDGESGSEEEPGAGEEEEEDGPRGPPPEPRAPLHAPPRRDSGGESSSDDEELDSTVSDTCTSNTSLSQEDGFSTSATSSKHQKKKDKKKRVKKERKKEKKRARKEKRRKREEHRERKRQRKRKLEREAERTTSAEHAAKRRKKRHNEGSATSFADGDFSDAADESADRDRTRRGERNEAPAYEMATRANFEKYKDALLSRVPKGVKSRFREGGFSRWGKDWLPVLELGPFDVEPGPVRDMWLEMFDNTQENGRDMTRLVFWYGVKFEDRGQAYSFVPANKLIEYEEGQRKGHNKMPKKVQKKTEKRSKLTKTEEQIKRGLKEIEGDMQRDKPDRAAWMMQFKEDYELAEEDLAREEAESKLQSALLEEEEDGEHEQEKDAITKRKPGRPKKEESAATAAIDKPTKRPKEEESAATAAIDKPTKRKPGRPKKVVDALMDAPMPPEEEGVVEVKKKSGKRKKSEKEKAEKAAAKAIVKAAAKAKKATAKKWVTVDEDQDSEMEMEDDDDDKDDDRDYDVDADSGEDRDMNVDNNGNDSDAGKSKKRKAEDTHEKKSETESKTTMTEEEKAKKCKVDDASDKKSETKSETTTTEEEKANECKEDDAPDNKSETKSKTTMTEEEKAIERRARGAEYREKKAREKAKSQGLEYVKGRVGRKSKHTMLEEEQQKFTKCEEIFLPIMERLTEAKDASNVKGALKYINSIMDRVEMLTPPFLREYPLGMLMKTVRKSFEGMHPEVKERSKRLTAEMKRVYTEKEKKTPEDFEPVKNMIIMPKLALEEQVDDRQESSCSALDSVKSEKISIKSEEVVIKSEEVVTKSEEVVTKSEKIEIKREKIEIERAKIEIEREKIEIKRQNIEIKREKIEIKREKIAVKAEKDEISAEQSIPKRNFSEKNLSKPMRRKIGGPSSSECPPNSVKPEPPAAPKQKKTFSIKGMFEKPKPARKPKITAPAPSAIAPGQPSPRPKSLPTWVTGPAAKAERFREHHAEKRGFGAEFLLDAASSVPSSPSRRFDPASVSRSLEAAIFAATKSRGRDWRQYWEKLHDVVAMLSPGKNKSNAVLQGIVSGDYKEPSELVKLSRREIQSLNRHKS